MNIFTKRILSLTVTLFLIVSLFSFAFSAATPQTLKISVAADKTEVKAGDTVTYTVSIGSVQNLMAIRIEMSIPQGLLFLPGSGKTLSGVMDTLGASSCKFYEGGLCFLSDTDPQNGYSSSGSLKLFSFQCVVDSDASGDLSMGFVKDSNGNNYTKNEGACNLEYSTSQSKITVKQQSSEIKLNVSVSGDSQITLGKTAKLTCSASASDGSSVSYQWYSSDSGKVNDGDRISGETKSSLSVKPDAVGDTYYFCRVTSGNIAVDSEVIKVTTKKEEVTPTPVARIKVNGSEKTSVTVKQNETVKIVCDASVSDNSALSYAWYECFDVNLSNKSKINGEISNTLVCDTSKTGKKYYVCLVSTLKRGVYSSVVSVTVEKKENEQPIPSGTPVVEITADSHSVDANVALKLKCSASVEDGSKLSYQWYKTSTGKVADGKYINGATESTYSAKESEAGVYYYFCGVTTGNGGKAYSEVWKVTVNKAEASETVEIVTSELDKGKVGESYKDYIRFKGTGVKLYFKNNENPLAGSGLSMSSSGTISGTPKTAGKYKFTVVAKLDGEVKDEKTFTIVINENKTEPEKPTEPEITFEQMEIDSGIVNREYYFKFADDGLSYEIYSDEKNVGEFDKTGLVLAGDGTLIGTPTECGKYVFFVCAKEGDTEKYYEISFSVEEQTDIPDDPSDPSEPNEPDNPEEPTEPTEPDNPVGPTEPDEPDNPGEKPTVNPLVAFFVNNRSMLGWVLAGILSVIVLILVIALANKSNNG